MAKKIGDRIRFRLIPAPWSEQGPGEPMKTVPGKREIMIEWGASATSVGYCERGPDGIWRASPDERRCRGLQHIFEAKEIEKSARRIGEVRKAIRDGVNASQTAMEARQAAKQAQAPACAGPRRVSMAGMPSGAGERREGSPGEGQGARMSARRRGTGR